MFGVLTKPFRKATRKARDTAQLLKIYRRGLVLVGLFQRASDDWNARRANGEDMSKSIFASKVFWFNVVMGANQLAQVLPLPAEYAALITAVGNVALRFTTSTPVHVV